MCVSFCKFKLTNLKLNLKNHFYSHSLIIKIFNKKKKKRKRKTMYNHHIFIRLLLIICNMKTNIIIEIITQEDTIIYLCRN